ncbi:MAG: hypothetical protein HY951_11630 [Bacteroidia bacterium]|nr:hypothetical protein [Bacteroidia bacterium]
MKNNKVSKSGLSQNSMNSIALNLIKGGESQTCDCPAPQSTCGVTPHAKCVEIQAAGCKIN